MEFPLTTHKINDIMTSKERKQRGGDRTMKSKRVEIRAMLIYAFVTFIANCVASVVAGWAVKALVQPLMGKVPDALAIVLVIAVCALFTLLVPLIGVYFCFRSMTPGQYYPTEDRFRWLKSCAWLVLPVEIIRFFICLVTLGHINRTGMLALLPTFLFENTYLVWSNRTDAVRNLLAYSIADFAVYFVCYAIYAAAYLCLVALVYRHFWLVGKQEREDLIVHKDEVTYY